ncbi:MAG: 30S ribosomal protein S8 [Candidatus Peregrinibacteria bacterium]
MTDSIADLLTRMRNAFHAQQETTVVPHSKLNMAVLKVLKDRDFIKDYKPVKDGSFNKIEIVLNRERTSLNLKRISKPGQRIYISKSEIKPVCNRYGIAIISTSKGIMTGEDARKTGIGGEYICQAW